MRGSVIKRGKNYSIAYYIGKDETGKWRQKWESGFPSKKEAERILRERISVVESTYNGNLSCKTLGDFLHYWLEVYCEKNLAPNTVRGYRTNIEKHIIPHIGNILMIKLGPKDLQDLYYKLEAQNLSSTTVRYVHNNLHRALAYGVKMQFIPKNPADMATPPRPQHYEATILNPDQVLILLQACESKDLFWPVLLAVTLGLRRGEALGLRWEDVDFGNKMIYVHHSAHTDSVKTFEIAKTKSRSSNRTLLLPDYVYECLQIRYEYLQERRKVLGKSFNSFDVVCFREDGTPYTTNALQHQFRKMITDLKMPEIRFHDLRHTNATMLLRKKIPAKIVSSMLGHSTIKLTMDTYSHVVPEMQEEAVSAVNSILQKL